MTRIWKLIVDDRGATAIEYGLIVALIALAVFGAMQFATDQTVTMWYNTANVLDEAIA